MKIPQMRGAVGAAVMSVAIAGAVGGNAVASAATAHPAVASAVSTAMHAHRGDLVSVTPVATLSAAEVTAAAGEIGFDAADVRYGVHGYRIVYRTVDWYGRPTTASGLVVLPDAKPGKLPTIVYEHGTLAYRAGAASVTAESGDRTAAELFASAGYVAVAPDYLGLGTGPGFHPYVDTKTEVSASLDMLPAAAELARQHGYAMDQRLHVTGFSQGGQAAMAVGKALSAKQDMPWRLAALAPISGPYAIQDVELPALLDHPGDGPGEIDPGEGVFYIAYWTVSMNRLYHLYDTPSQAFRAPYDQTVEQLFDGYHDEETIAAGLPANPMELLTPEFVQRLRNPSGALLTAATANDSTCEWAPESPVRLFAADGDRDVPIANAQRCQAQLAAHGVHVPLIDVGGVDHNGSAVASVPKVLDWFLAER